MPKPCTMDAYSRQLGQCSTSGSTVGRGGSFSSRTLPKDRKKAAGVQLKAAVPFGQPLSGSAIHRKPQSQVHKQTLLSFNLLDADCMPVVCQLVDFFLRDAVVFRRCCQVE